MKIRYYLYKVFLCYDHTVLKQFHLNFKLNVINAIIELAITVF